MKLRGDSVYAPYLGIQYEAHGGQAKYESNQPVIANKPFSIISINLT